MNENEIDIENELKHWGILGMHWGIRRFQNPDGSLTPEGRERYLKKVDDAIKNENKSYKVTSKAIDEFNKKLPELNAYLEKQGWLGDDWQAHEKESNEYLAKEWKKIFKELANKEYGEIANKVYDNEEEWMSQFLYYHLYTDEFTKRQGLYASDEFTENDLKHWGILGMKWGIRNYQNPDGSLTPLGRIRYGVGVKKDVTGNVMGINDANSLSDEELKRMTRRYQNQAEYYQARNNYVYQEKKFKENTAPPQKEHRPSRIGRFLDNVFVQPLEGVLSKNASFLYGMLGYEMLKDSHPQAAEMYFNSIAGISYHKKDPKKEKLEERQQYLNEIETENKIREAERKRDDPYSGMSEPNFGKNKGGSTEARKAYYNTRKEAEQKLNDLVFPDLGTADKPKKPEDLPSNEDIREAIQAYNFIYGKDRPLSSYF